MGLSGEVKPGRVATRRLGRQDVVLWRTAQGALHANRPYCPHLGAHLGVGGTVQGAPRRLPHLGGDAAVQLLGFEIRSPASRCRPTQASVNGRTLAASSWFFITVPPHHPDGGTDEGISRYRWPCGSILQQAWVRTQVLDKAPVRSQLGETDRHSASHSTLGIDHLGIDWA
ncbi:Rieske 2Fe-2S domain-containing protein [Streptomyces sp. NPDC054950]